MDVNAVKNFVSPPAAQTASSIALVWDKPDEDVCKYSVYMNGTYIADTSCTDYTAEGLTAQTEYTFSVRAVCDSCELQSGEIKLSTKPEPDMYNIIEFGAIADGITSNTKVIQQAIDACTEGGTVYIPEGIFVTGALYLKSNMTLFIAENGILMGSCDLAEYPLMQYRFEGIEQMCYASLINTDGEKKENITIEGKGTINANGVKLRQAQLADAQGKPGRAVCIRNTTNLYFKDITVRQSPAWCVHTIYCENISMNNVKIHTKYDENGQKYTHIVNGDGFDPDSCRNVYVFHSMIASQDDCIAIKSGKNEQGREIGIPSEQIQIMNCTFKSGFGVVIGSEMSGSVRNVLVRDCTFENTHSIASIKPPRGRGGMVENICYEACTLKNTDAEQKDCEWFRGAVNIDMFYSHKEFDANKWQEIDDGTPVINGVYFKNIKLETVAGTAIYLAGLPEQPLKNICFENVCAKGKYGIKVVNTDGLRVSNMIVKTYDREELI